MVYHQNLSWSVYFSCLQVFTRANALRPQEDEKPVSSPLTEELSPEYILNTTDGPQGDPFLHVESAEEQEEETSPQPKHWQRKRRAPKCYHCKRTQDQNRIGLPEPLLTCAGCKKNGAPIMQPSSEPELIHSHIRSSQLYGVRM